MRYKGLINVPSEPTKDINPQPGFNELRELRGFSILDQQRTRGSLGMRRQRRNELEQRTSLAASGFGNVKNEVLFLLKFKGF